MMLMRTHTKRPAKNAGRAAWRGLLGLLAVLSLSLAVPGQAQTLRLEPLTSPTSVVEAGAYRLLASVGAPAVGSPLSVQRAHHRSGSAGAGLAVDEVAEGVPSSFALESNYPNPFNPETTIPFALPEASEVRLVVYDVTGRQVALLVEGQLSAGHHTVAFRGDHLASGVYLVRMQAGDFSEVRRMTLVK